MDITLTMPEWVKTKLGGARTHFCTLEDRMDLVLRCARMNFEKDTGGPFAAAVFERDSGKLVSIGVNRVVANNCSSAHAEIMALSLAQKALGTYDLGAARLPVHQLVVNWRPCAMCMGAVLWSGVRSLVVAGVGEELEAFTGFDEGPVHPEWREELLKRGIRVHDNVLREEAVAIFRKFRESGKIVYNAGKGRPASAHPAKAIPASVLAIRRRVQKKTKALMQGPKLKLNNFHAVLPGGYRRSFDSIAMNELYGNSKSGKKLRKVTLAEFLREVDRTIEELGMDPMEIIRLHGGRDYDAMYRYILPIYIRLLEKGYKHYPDLTA
ncbi:MAG: deaminase [Elusimicrobiota bacterium]|jgi:tRNA(Arg) A34 adenosine deaminase TadA